MPQLIIPAVIMGGATMGAAAISSSQQAKAAKNAEQLAQDQQSQALAEQRRLEEKYGLTPGELEREQRLFGVAQGETPIKMDSTGLEAKQQETLKQRAGNTGEELLAGVGPNTKALLDQIAQRSGMTGEELFKSEGAIPAALQDQILKEAQNPGGNYNDTLTQQLELSRQMVNAEANKRGVFGGQPEGGIRFENLGRAGVDLAIKSATEKEAARQQDLVNASTLSTLFRDLSSSARGDQATASQEGVSAQDKARAELNAFLENMQNQSASSKGRVAQMASGASQVAAQQTSNAYSNLIGLEGYKGTIQGPAQAGLTAIGQVGADYLGQNLKAPVKDTSTTPSSYDELMKTLGDKPDSIGTLGDLAGSDILAQIKKRNPIYQY